MFKQKFLLKLENKTKSFWNKPEWRNQILTVHYLFCLVHTLQLTYSKITYLKVNL